MTLLLWSRVGFLVLLGALVAMYSWVTYQTRHD
jgi:hypothetical protein